MNDAGLGNTDGFFKKEVRVNSGIGDGIHGGMVNLLVVCEVPF